MFSGAKKSARRTLIAFGIIFGVILFLGFFGSFLWGLIGVNIDYSHGERSVKIIKLSEKGFIWKTWEAEGVLTQGNFGVTYVWDFSVDNWDPNKQKLITELQTAFDTGQTVKVVYDQKGGSVPWRSETPYFVKDITVLR